MRTSMIAAALAAAAATPALAQYGPVTITGTVSSNTLQGGRLQGLAPGAPVRMFFRTLPGGFNPRWGDTGRFVNVDEASFELHVGTGPDERILFSAANNTSLLMTNAGYVTSVVHQDTIEFFQMRLDSSLYSVYMQFRNSADDIWDSPLIALLPPVTDHSHFDFKRWEVSDAFNPAMTSPGPIITFDFNGQITVPCAADLNASGDTTVQDLFDFLSAFFANDPAGDFNGSGSISVQDIFDFLFAWFRGCPA